MRVWSGADLAAVGNNNMSDPANWVGNVAPQPEDNLVFPTSYASSTTINDDLGANFRLLDHDFGLELQLLHQQLLERAVDGELHGRQCHGKQHLRRAAADRPGHNAGHAGRNHLQRQPRRHAQPHQHHRYRRNPVADADHRRAGTTNISGNITDGGGLTKNGAGTLVLSGNNTYEGFTLINQGVVNVQSNNALGSSSTGTLVNTGAALQLQGSSLNINEPLELNGNGIGVGSPVRACQSTGWGRCALCPTARPP